MNRRKENALRSIRALRDRLSSGAVAAIVGAFYTMVDLITMYFKFYAQAIEKCAQNAQAAAQSAQAIVQTTGEKCAQIEWLIKLAEIVPDLLFHAAVIIGLSYIALSILDLVNVISDLVRSSEDFGKHLVQIQQNSHLAVSREMSRFQKQHRTEIIGEFLEKWYAELQYALSLTLDDKCFTVKSEFQALRSYDIFWNLLAKEQEKRQRHHQLTVLIIHSSSFDIWNKYAISDKLLKSHKVLRELGGKVTRILCTKVKKQGTVPKKNGDPPDEVIEAAKKMKAADIDVLYYNIETAKVDFDFEWDFLYVKELDTAVIWESFTTGGNIKESIYQIGNRFKGYDLEELWHRIYENSEKIGED